MGGFFGSFERKMKTAERSEEAGIELLRLVRKKSSKYARPLGSYYEDFIQDRVLEILSCGRGLQENEAARFEA